MKYTMHIIAILITFTLDGVEVDHTVFMEKRFSANPDKDLIDHRLRSHKRFVVISTLHGNNLAKLKRDIKAYHESPAFHADLTSANVGYAEHHIVTDVELQAYQADELERQKQYQVKAERSAARKAKWQSKIIIRKAPLNKK